MREPLAEIIKTQPMEKILAFIKDTYQDIEVFENLKINKYFTATYVIAQRHDNFH